MDCSIIKKELSSFLWFLVQNLQKYCWKKYVKKIFWKNTVFFVVVCFYLDILVLFCFSSLDLCFWAKGKIRQSDAQEINCQGERMGRKSVRNDFREQTFSSHLVLDGLRKASSRVECDSAWVKGPCPHVTSENILPVPQKVKHRKKKKKKLSIALLYNAAIPFLSICMLSIATLFIMDQQWRHL